MHLFVAALQGGKNRLPVALDVGAVGVQVGFESRLLQDAFTRSDVRAQAHAHAQRNDAKVGDHVHDRGVYGLCHPLATPGDGQV